MPQDDVLGLVLGAEHPMAKRVLWLHTQPEHYFNLMMDDLATGDGYLLDGMADEVARARDGKEIEYVAAFAWKGRGIYTENSLPRRVRTIIPRPLSGKTEQPPSVFGRYHVDWKADLFAEKFDAVIVSGYALRLHREVLGECHRRGIPVALWSDSNMRAELGAGLKQRLKRTIKKWALHRIVSRANLLLTANSCGIDYWRHYGAPAGKIVLCPCYSDYARVDAARTGTRAEALRAAGISEDVPYIYSAARLVPAKGLDVAIHAFAASGAAKWWKYLIAGAGPLEAELKQLVQSTGAGESIQFIGFQQPSANLALMAHADLMLLPSRFEPHGIVVGEALAGGTPVIASDVVGAARDLVQDGEDGIIFRSDDMGDLSHKLALAAEPTRLAAMRRAARPAFEKWYRKTAPLTIIPSAVHRLLGG